MEGERALFISTDLIDEIGGSGSVTAVFLSMQTAAKTTPSLICWQAWRTMASTGPQSGRTPSHTLLLVPEATTVTVMRKKQSQSWTGRRLSSA